MESADAEEATAARPRMSPGARWATGVVTVLLAAGATWYGLDQASAPVRWRDVGFEIVSSTEAAATYDVFLYSDSDAICRVRALNAEHGEVGAIDVLVERSAGTEQRLTSTLSTVERAVAVTVAYCDIPR